MDSLLTSGATGDLCYVTLIAMLCFLGFFGSIFLVDLIARISRRYREHVKEHLIAKF